VIEESTIAEREKLSFLLFLEENFSSIFGGAFFSDIFLLFDPTKLI
jgi:hypothetical protein